MVYQPQDTIVSVAQQRALDHPERNYVTFLQDGDDQEAKLSYGELDRSARQVAAWLKDRGLGKGDRALVILPNSLEFTQIFYGCLYGGVLAVPLSEPAGPKQMQSYLETFLPTVKTSRPGILITTPLLVDFLKTQVPPPLAEIFSKITIASADDILSDTPSTCDLPELGPDDTAYLQFTSGSTGVPKGIKIGHGNIMVNMEQARVFGNWEEGKGTGLWLPLFHDFGLAAGMLGALYNGGFVVLMTPVHFIVKPLRWMRAMSKYRCEYSYAPPFAFDISHKKVTAEEKKDLDLSCIVSMVYGAEPVHYSGVKKFNEWFADCGLKPTAVRPGFGMAETVIMFSESGGLETQCADRHLLETEGKLRLIEESAPEEDKKYLVSLGTHMHDHEIVIKDEHNRPLPEGEVGEIMITGPSVCQGYFENPKATEETFRQEIEGKQGRFLETGDLGLLWKDKLYFTGRIKDLVIIRGRNYYPQDIEYAVPQVEEIRPGCVIAYSTVDGNSEEHLVLAMEIRKDLLKDMDMFKNYVLPAIDHKVVETIGQQFQIHPAKRLYLQPGTITKTSSGKIKHHANRKRFMGGDFEGLLAVLPEEPEEVVPELSGIQATVVKLFEKIVEQEAILDEPLLDLGGDSIKVLEFLETVQETYPVTDEDIMDVVDETTTLNDIVNWLEERS
ncbi:MAG: AMP-binding protein [Proteobacteria bacterium]|nr:AMP-binding protein [Pseudomonadota bacterium]